jgi:hypothetical protein
MIQLILILISGGSYVYEYFIKYIDTDIQTIVANNCALLNHKNPLEEVLT